MNIRKVRQQTTGLILSLWNSVKKYWCKGVGHKIFMLLAATVLLIVFVMYSVGQWYIFRHKNEPLVFGATFVPSYARYLGLEPQETLQAMIDDLGLRRFRLVSYWSEIEKQKDAYDFSELDWQFDAVNSASGSVTLAIGLRQPRWPECHMPDWAKSTNTDSWYPELKIFITKVVERYRNNPALQGYQLENEFFLDAFGNCPDHSRWRLQEEYDLVKSLDANKPLTMTRSNNAIPSWPVREPLSNINGASVYKRVWDGYITKRYFEYPLPAWFYAFLAGGAEMTTGRNTFIHELQAEPWLPTGMSLISASTQEMYKSMSPARLSNQIDYGVKTGMRTIDLWGAEWWYYMKTKRDVPDLWQTVKDKISSYD